MIVQKRLQNDILFLELFRNISKSRKNLSFSNFEMRFSATYFYCPEEFVINSEKRFIHWKEFQIEFPKCHFGKWLLCNIQEPFAYKWHMYTEEVYVYLLASKASKSFFGTIRAATAVAVARSGKIPFYITSQHRHNCWYPLI